MDITLNLKDNERLGVAVSGGRDSMALLHCLIKQGYRDRLTVINIEHGLRGVKSINESKFVIDYCAAYGVECLSISVDAAGYSKAEKLTIEQSARELRYIEFNKLLKLGKVDYIALAHHKGDQAETIMMRILRGTGINGLTGMNSVRDRFIRPLLDISREEINTYIKHNSIPYVEDDSNSNNYYTRNFIRNQAFPLISKKFPDYESALVRLSANAREDNEYIMSSVIQPKIIGGNATLPLDVLNQHRSLSSRSIMLAFAALGIIQDIERRHIDIILSMINLNNGDSVDMPYGVKVYREYDKLTFERIAGGYAMEGSAEFKDGLVRLGNCVIEVKPYSGDGLRFDRDKIPVGSIIRFRQEGDYISKFGGGSKSLSDYMTDLKIPKRLRNTIPLVAKDKEIMILCGIEISAKVAVDRTTKRIYTITSGVKDEQ